MGDFDQNFSGFALLNEALERKRNRKFIDEQRRFDESFRASENEKARVSEEKMTRIRTGPQYMQQNRENRILENALKAGGEISKVISESPFGELSQNRIAAIGSKYNQLTPDQSAKMMADLSEGKGLAMAYQHSLLMPEGPGKALFQERLKAIQGYNAFIKKEEARNTRWEDLIKLEDSGKNLTKHPFDPTYVIPAFKRAISELLPDDYDPSKPLIPQVAKMEQSGKLTDWGDRQEQLINTLTQSIQATDPVLANNPIRAKQAAVRLYNRIGLNPLEVLQKRDKDGIVIDAGNGEQQYNTIEVDVEVSKIFQSLNEEREAAASEERKSAFSKKLKKGMPKWGGGETATVDDMRNFIMQGDTPSTGAAQGSKTTPVAKAARGQE